MKICTNKDIYVNDMINVIGFKNIRGINTII